MAPDSTSRKARTVELEVLEEQLARTVPAGTVLFREGDEPREIFLVQRGEIHLQKTVRGEALCLAMLREGDFFGEEALLGDRRAVGAVAARESRLLSIDRVRFLKAVNESEPLRHRVFERLGARLSDLYQRLADQVGSDPLTRMAQALERLAASGEVLPDGRRRLALTTAEDALLTATAGLLPSQGRWVAARLWQAGILGRDAEGRLWVAGEKDLLEFRRYCELKRRMDPIIPEDLADVSGLSLAEVEVLTRRVMRRHLDARAGRPEFPTAYETYLSLKKRFEGHVSGEPTTESP